jgi:hypothetical protein
VPSDAAVTFVRNPDPRPSRVDSWIERLGPKSRFVFVVVFFWAVEIIGGTVGGTSFGTCVFPFFGTLYGFFIGALAGLAGGLPAGVAVATALALSTKSSPWRRQRNAVLAAIGGNVALMFLVGLFWNDRADLWMFPMLPSITLGAMWAAAMVVRTTSSPQLRSEYRADVHGRSVKFYHYMLSTLLPLGFWIIYPIVGALQ